MAFALVGGVHAQGVNDFVINDFHGRYELKNDAPGGRLLVSESIDLTFSGMNRGILRSIPRKYQNRDMLMKVHEVFRDDRPEEFTTYNDSSGNRIIKIGDPEKYITGNHRYVIKYELQRSVVMKFDGYDEWYWDINGVGWRQPFEKIRGELVVEEGIMLAEPKSACYTGRQGSTDNDCIITATNTGYTFETTRRLNAGETLTVATGLQPVFQPYTFNDYIKDNWYRYIGIFPGIALAIWAFSVWRKHGRDYAGKGTIVPQYEPPKGLAPSEVGLLADYQVQPRDISAALIDLAIRKYLVIHDDSKKRLGIFKSRQFALELINADFSGLKPFESALLKAIFPSQQAGEKIEIKKLKRHHMAMQIQMIIKDLHQSLEKEYGLIEPTGKKWMAIFFVLAVVIYFPIMFLGQTPFGPGAIIGGVIASISLIVFAILMPRRSHAGVAAYEHVKGLELYMKTAEADRLNMMQSVESPYAQPSKTYDLFEKLLPYAVALGVEKSWAKQFDGVFSETPDWYRGGGATNLHAAALATGLTSGLSSMNQAFSASSGSSGGGSAGGGGGGGGGGGW